MMHVVIEKGEKLTIILEGTDGEFVVSYGTTHHDALTVVADIPDSLGRSGVIYAECFNPLKLPPDNGEDAVAASLEQHQAAAVAEAIGMMTDGEILHLYNLYEAAAQKRGLMGA